MPESVEFQLKLQDAMSAALHGAAGAATKLDEALKKAAGSVEHIEKAEGKAGHESRNFAEQLGHIYERFIEWKIVEFSTERLLEFGRALVETTIEITDFGYRSELALRALNNETEEAAPKTREMLAEVKQFALDAGQPLEKVEEAFLALKRAGLSDEWIRPLVAAAGDLAALGGHPEQFSEIAQSFARIGAQGGIGRAAQELMHSGVQAGVLSKNLGLGVLNSQQLLNSLSKHPVELTVALRGLEETIRQTANEKLLGTMFKESADTIGGGIQRIKTLWEIMVDDLNSDPIFKTMREDFVGLVNNLQARLPTLEMQFSATFDPIIKAIDKFISDPDAVQRLFNNALKGIEAVAKIIPPVIRGLEWIADHLPGNGTTTTGTGTGPAPVISDLTQLQSHLGLQIKSPEQIQLADAARVRERGGLAEPRVLADGGPIHKTGMALVHAGEFVVPAGGARLEGGGRGGHSIDAPITINVHVEGDGDGLTEEGLSLQLRELLPGVLVPAREQLATTVGAA